MGYAKNTSYKGNDPMKKTPKRNAATIGTLMGIAPSGNSQRVLTTVARKPAKNKAAL